MIAEVLVDSLIVLAVVIVYLGLLATTSIDRSGLRYWSASMACALVVILTIRAVLA